MATAAGGTGVPDPVRTGGTSGGRPVGLGRLSLRARVVAIAMMLVAVALVVTQTVLLGVLDRYLTDQVDRQLQQAARVLAVRPMEPNATAAPSPQEVPERRLRTPNGLPSRIVATYLTLDGSVVRHARAPGAEDEAGPRLPVLDRSEVARRDRRAFTTGAAAGGDGRYRVVAVALDDGTGTVVAAQTLRDVDAAVQRMRNVCLTLGAGCLVVLAAAGWFAVRAGLRPLRRIEQTAAAIAAGDLSHRVPEAARGTEIGRLSAALNGMLAQIETAFEARARSEARMLRFVADAGHELRTPLSSVRGFAELHRLGGLREPDEVARMMRRIEDEAARMGGLVEDLLQLARLDEQRPLRRDPVDLRMLAADALDDIRTLAPDRPVSLAGPDGRPARPTEVPGDEPRLRQVVANLVANALRHTPDGTAVDLTVGFLSDGTALFEVRDHGDGLSEADAKRVFERFYRVDSSRSRGNGGGSGLGLAIVAALVQAHDGTVTASSGTGAAFRVLLPAPRAHAGEFSAQQTLIAGQKPK